MEFLDIKNNEKVKEYEDFLQKHPKGHFAQSTKWAALKTEWGFEAIILRNENGEIYASMGVLIRKIPLCGSILYSPRGPVCDVEDKNALFELINGAKVLAKKYHAYILKMDTDVKSDNEIFKNNAKELGFTIKDSKNFEGIQPRYVFRLYLSGRNEEELMASFHSKTRYNIRVAIKNGVVVKQMDKSAVKDFYKIMCETGTRDNFIIRTERYFSLLLDSLGENARLYMAYLNEKPIAGTIAIAYGNKVWYLYGASSNSYRNVMPNYLLQFEMIKWAVERNAEIYDFRGVSGDLSKDNPLYGLYRFKKGFNGEFTEFVGELNYVFKPKTNKFANLLQSVYKKINRIRYHIKG